MRRQHRLVVARAVQRTAIFRAVETELDRIDPRCAQRKCRAADDDADQDAGDEIPVHDDEDDRQQRQVFIGESRAGAYDPSVQKVGAEIDIRPPRTNSAYSQQQRSKGQHQQGDCGGRQAGKPAGSSAVEIEPGAADRNAAGIAVKYPRQHVGEAGASQFALEVASRWDGDLDAVVLNKVLDAVDENDGDRLPQVRQQAPGIAFEFIGVHGSTMETFGGGRKVQPAACVSAVETPASQNAMCAATTPPIRMASSPNEVRVVPGQIKHQRHGAGRRQFGQRQEIGEAVERRKLQNVAR